MSLYPLLLSSYKLSSRFSSIYRFLNLAVISLVIADPILCDSSVVAFIAFVCSAKYN